jgi:hypothetical protein
MLTVVTNRDANHLTPNVDPVPVGSVDAFGRDDGWIGDRPADCGNFWIPRGNVDDPPYLSSGKLAITPGLGSFLGSIWLGGSDDAVEFDLTTGPDLSSTKGVLCYIVGGDRPEFGATFEQVIVTIYSTITRIQRSNSGTITDVASGVGSSASTSYRFYISARAATGGWVVRVDRSALDGTGRVTLVTSLVTSAATVGWLSFATSGSMSGVTIDNLDRAAIPGGYFLDTFDSGLDAGWTTDQGTWSTDGSGYAYSTTGNDADEITRDFGQIDMTARVTLPALPTGKGANLLARHVDANNHFLFIADRSANIVYLSKRVAGTYTTLAGPTAYTYAAGDILELAAIGTAIAARVIRGGSTHISLSATSSVLSTATKCGLSLGYNTASGVRFNDFTVYG